MSLPQLRSSKLTRRHFVKGALAPAGLLLVPRSPIRTSAAFEPARDGDAQRPEIIDTNVHLFPWPYRPLKYDRTESLVSKLRRHRITQAWAGSFEAVLQKQLDRANQRLANECREKGDGLLIPIGSVNPVWPDWEEDLRRCHEQYHMPGIRLYPAYHGYGLDHTEFPRLLAACAERTLFVQIAIRVEDERVHHPSLSAPVVSADPLPESLARVPEARVQLLNADTAFRNSRLVQTLTEQTGTTFDIAALEAQGGIGRLLQGSHTSYRGSSVPVERLLFGSHAPFFPCESSLLKLFESPLDLQQLTMIMNANAQRFLG